MQKTRQKILQYLKQHGEATVEDLSRALDDLTPVTVRHHLDVLRGDGMVSAPEIRHRTTPGRPRYVYVLTQKAESLFPKNVNVLATHMVSELKQTVDSSQLNVIFEGIADRMASEFDSGPDGESFEDRLDRVVTHLTEHGYEARWETSDQGYVIHTSNCPYGGVADSHDEICLLDIRYISHLLGVVPRRLGHLREGEESCSYLVADHLAVASG